MTSVSGSCICKKVTYTFTGEPAKTAVCHCRECKKLTGSAFTYNLMVPQGNFKWTSGSPKSNRFIQESGITVDYRFCPDCGTVLFKETEDLAKGFYLVQAGTVDGGGSSWKGMPDVEFWTSRRAEWVKPLEGVAQMAKFE